MLTRIGANPGPEWMKRLGNGSLSPEELRRKFRRVFLFFAIFQAAAFITADIARYRNPHRGSAYNSAIKIGDLPLVSVGGRAHGVFAFGGFATGVFAMGGVAIGVIAYGGLSVGVVSVGGLSIAILALGAVAVGWRALGAVAVGEAALGALAIGRYAYAGDGVAMGSEEASGKQKESLFG